MNKILNPFESLSIGRAWIWGLAGAAFSLGLLFLVQDASITLSNLVTNLLLWLPLATLLYLAALIFSRSRIRAVDIYATCLFALLPMMLVQSVANSLIFLLHAHTFDPRSVADVLSRLLYNLLVILLSVSMVWSMVWGSQAYLVSANLKGGRGVTIFLVCFMIVNLAIQMALYYYYVP